MNQAVPEESRGGPITQSDADCGDLVPNAAVGGGRMARLAAFSERGP
jgi:hypothetical protein